jgi:hypothetical protein
MAAPEDILELRGFVAEPDDTNGWSDAKLGLYLDEAITVNSAAAQVWSVKAADFAGLVDVSESGSSRKLGDLYKNAKEMAGYFRGLDNSDVAVVVDVPVVTRIRRGF